MSRVVLKILNNAFLAVGVFVLVLFSAIYLTLGRGAKDSLIEQMLHREQLAVRAGAKSLETFLTFSGRSLTTLSLDRSIRSFDQEASQVLSGYIKVWRETPVAGVILVNEEGRVVFNESRTGISDVGTSVADRDYFLWAKGDPKEDYFISEAFVSRVGYTKGRYIITVSAPVRGEEGEFKGVLTSALLLDDLAKDYISPLKITETSHVYLTNSVGEVVYTSQEAVLGKNFFEEMKERPFLGSRVLAEKLKEIIESRKEGKLDVVYPVNEAYDLSRMLVAYAPLKVGENDFMLGMSTPVENALEFIVPDYLKHLGTLGVIVVSFLVVSIRLAKKYGYKEAVEVEHEKHGVIS